MFWSTTRKKQILEATHAECPSCSEVSSVKEWNNLVVQTYGTGSPDIRRAAVNRKNSFPFQCPECFKGYSAHILKFHNTSSVRKNVTAKSIEMTQ
jgi:predicted RNA-binding Zn-ribbon protein involved in translation (DUF1610 family)